MSETRNTKLSYLYRDGSNYKVSGTVIFSGAITLGDRDRLLGGMLPSSDDDLWGVIIPGQVGLADLQDRFYEREIAMIEAMLAPQEGPVRTLIDPGERDRYQTLLKQMRATKPQWRDTDDHVFHQVTDIVLTLEPPTDPRSILEFISDVLRVDWDESWRPSFYEEMVANYEAAIASGKGDGPEVP